MPDLNYDFNDDNAVNLLDARAMIKAIQYCTELKQDGVLNQQDVDVLQKMLDNGQTLLPEYYDFDGDGVVTQNDIDCLQKIVTYGDMNQDGTVDLVDVQLFLDMLYQR